jgi:hypothetical protein
MSQSVADDRLCISEQSWRAPQSYLGIYRLDETAARLLGGQWLFPTGQRAVTAWERGVVAWCWNGLDKGSPQLQNDQRWVVSGSKKYKGESWAVAKREIMYALDHPGGRFEKC